MSKKMKEEKCECKHDECCDEACECEKEQCEHDECECGCHHEGGLDKKLAEEYLNLARTIQADFDNYRKRTIEQMKQVKTDGMVQALGAFLPVVDVLEKAVKMTEDAKSKEGMNMVLTQLNNSMKELGVERVEVVGKPYSPDTAYAIASLNDDSKEDGIVIDEVSSAYKLGNKIIRYAQVVVNKIEK